jgi:hypothetical protein
MASLFKRKGKAELKQKRETEAILFHGHHSYHSRTFEESKTQPTVSVQVVYNRASTFSEEVAYIQQASHRTWHGYEPNFCIDTPGVVE